MKKLIFLIFLILQINIANAETASVNKEDCDTWIYKNYYKNVDSCDVCGYYKRNFYENRWEYLRDLFKHTEDNSQYLISPTDANSYTKFHKQNWSTLSYNLKNYINWNWGWNTSGLISNYLTSKNTLNQWEEYVLFHNYFRGWSKSDKSNLTSTTPIWITEYNIKYYKIGQWNVQINWNNVVTIWSEELRTDSEWNTYTFLNFNQDIKSVNTKIDTTKPLYHKECYVMLPAWCWDWIRNGWEQCDGTQHCDANCNILPYCWDWIVNWTEECDGWANCNTDCTNKISWGICWDYIVNIGEQCDQWPNWWSSCNANCTNKNPSGSWFCWDYVRWWSEECDEWPNWWTNCNANCTNKSSWWSNWGSSWWSSSSWICWDWIKQSSETCDFRDSSKTNWLNWTYCSASCKHTNDWLDLWCVPYWTYETETTIWWWMSTKWKDFYINNDSSNPIDLRWYKLCFKNTTPGLLENPVYSWLCSNTITQIVQPWEKIDLPQNASNQLYFKSKNWTDSAQIKQWELQLYLQNDEYTPPSDAKKVYKVNIVRPSVQTFGWGASVLENSNISDINDINQNNKNKNLILWNAWVDISSYADSNMSEEKKERIKQLISDNMDKLKNILNNSNSTSTQTTLWLPTEKYNGFENVFISKNNIELNDLNITGWNKTYIIEWDLTINWNITTSDNLLFVTKWWNIKIWANVSKIEAVLMSMKNNNNWWKIISENSPEQLYINWAIYWELDELLQNRTYISTDWNYVKVWTNVSFSSKILSNPAPLLSKFLWEYIEAERVSE